MLFWFLSFSLSLAHFLTLVKQDKYYLLSRIIFNENLDILNDLCIVKYERLKFLTNRYILINRLLKYILIRDWNYILNEVLCFLLQVTTLYLLLISLYFELLRFLTSTLLRWVTLSRLCFYSWDWDMYIPIYRFEYSAIYCFQSLRMKKI